MCFKKKKCFGLNFALFFVLSVMLVQPTAQKVGRLFDKNVVSSAAVLFVVVVCDAEGVIALCKLMQMQWLEYC